MRIERRVRQCALAFICLLASIELVAHDSEGSWDLSRPDSHAPIGVMGDHSHRTGEWMLSYRFMTMSMDGNRDQKQRITQEDVLVTYPVAPKSMTMQMHMLGAMYAPTDRVTFMAMVPFIDQDMDHETRTGIEFNTATSGIGDVSVSALVNTWDQKRHHVHLNLGLQAPTGSINERGDIPVRADAPLPYPMQVGSGSWSALFGGTYLGQSDHWSWGSQAMFTRRLDENDAQYKLGNQTQFSSWLSRLVSPRWSVAGRLKFNDTDSIRGADARLNVNMVPTADPSLRSGTLWSGSLSVNFKTRSGNRWALEIESPISQDLDGPQLETDLVVTAGWQYAF